MAMLTTRRSVMTLYSEPACPLSHSVRIVLAEKDIHVDIVYVTEGEEPEDLHDLNPYGSVLTLIDRDLVLYDIQIMMEYLDERFPHPPLMPVDPVSRATNRQIRYRVTRDLYALVADLSGSNEIAAANARKAMRDNLTAIAPALQQKPFFMSEDFSLADCCMAPLLWRLPSWGIKLPAQARALTQYAEQLFSRSSFRASLSPAERELTPIIHSSAARKS